MAPQEKKWSDAAERDLCVAILYSNPSRYDWSRVTTIMEGLGYVFTKDAMSNGRAHQSYKNLRQHLSKTILKDFKARCSEEVVAAAEATPPASATKPKATPRKAASTPRKRTKNGVKGQQAAITDAGDNNNGNNNNDEVDDDEMELDATPTKKLKKEDKVKKEDKTKKEEKAKKEEEAPATPAADQSATSDSEEKAPASDAESSA
ncbi:uncharacterized protein TRIREDRAFT_102780 [Trichoderma reesei QM6a]|uniref:Predicted protein n=1 Tax=Hypocrea jecorina (strain QM6a) TaxID=431241 RepID=G0R891_HYPJQ|nr:uncharacterized protein TRIREDRAFT_102780 [Trichoderma reesei QM6a]EGR52312.1 predicted protein [Trichoderma reesei QM6a]